MTGQTVYVGGVELTGSTDNPAYATTDDSGNVSTTGATADNCQIMWDGSTLILKNAYITNAAHNDSYSHPVEGAAIGVFNQNGAAELTIQLEGSKTIIEDVTTGIYVYASSSSTGDASLTITGSGSLNASGSSNGIRVLSNGGDAALTIQNADVTAENSSSSGNGVTVQTGSSSSASLSVDGGSLTATGSGNNGAGIRFSFGGDAVSGTASLSVSGSALVDARNGGIRAGDSDSAQNVTPASNSVGIVFDGNEGTVYGDVTLQEDLTISEGESLTIPDGSSLTTNGKLTVNGGELTGNVTGTVIYKVTGVSLNKTSLTLNVGGSETLTATITPSNATNKSVTWKSSNTSVATVGNGKVTAMGVGSTTITATVDGKSASCEVTVNKATPTYTVPTGLTATYDDKLSDITLPEGWAWENGTQSVGNVGDNTFTAIFTPDDTENYETVMVSLTVTVVQPDGPEPEEPETPVIPDMPDYYNIYVEECEGVTAEVSSEVVREGTSITLTVEVAEGYTAEDMTVKVKRSLFGYTEVIEPNDEGIYEIKNIYTDIYITVAGVEGEEETPTGIEELEGAKVYAKDGSIYVQTPKQEQVQIISISGAVLKNETQVGLQRYGLPRGIYIICIGEERFKVRN